MSARKPFGLPTNFRGTTGSAKDSILLFQNGGTSNLAREDLPVGSNLVDHWKIFISMAYGAGNDFPHSVLGWPIIGAPGSACTETYLLIGPFSSKEETENAISYIKTKFFRFLVMLHKPTQDATRTVYSLVPKQDFSRGYDDAFLYDHYGLSVEERHFIESMVRKMELVSE